jgi:hypothetical protein
MDLLDYPVRICVAGSRSWHNAYLFDICLRAFLSWAGAGQKYALISGDAWRGPDRLAIEWAEEHSVSCFTFPADWDGLGKAAGHIRNAEMRKVLTHLLVFWDGESRGTKEMIENTQKQGIHVSMILVKPDQWWLDYQARRKARFSANRFKARHHEWKPQGS